MTGLLDSLAEAGGYPKTKSVERGFQKTASGKRKQTCSSKCSIQMDFHLVLIDKRRKIWIEG